MVIAAGDNGCRVKLDGGPEVDIAGIRANTGEPIKLFLRAERAQIGKSLPDKSLPDKSFPNEPGFATLDGTITTCDYLGVLTRYVVDVAGVSFVVLQSAGGSVLRPRDRVTVRIPSDAWMKF